MKRLSIATLALVCLVDLVGCELPNYVPPPVTASMAKSSAKHVDPSTPLRTSLATLEEGRVLFVHRCIECHTLPAFWHYSAKDWPPILDEMAHRSRLTPGEREAILAYILAARSARS